MSRSNDPRAEGRSVRRTPLWLQFATFVVLSVALLAALLAVYPPGYPGPDEDRPVEMKDPAVAASLDAAALSQGARVLIGSGLQNHFGMGTGPWNPLKGHSSITDINFPDLKDGAAVVTAKAEVVLTGWLPYTLHVDSMEVTMVPVVIDDLQGHIKVAMEPVVTDLRIREFGESALGARLNELAAHIITEGVKPVESKIDGIELKIDVKPEVKSVRYDFGRIVIAAEDDSLLVGAGPIVKKAETRP